MKDERETRLYRIATFAMEAMLYEVCAAPKPGLVDRLGNGAHGDMDVFTFLSGAAGLHGCYDTMARIGFEWRYAPVKNMWPSLREEGKKAEERMFERTGGVNTQKGEIFSLGILCACAGRLVEKGKPAVDEILALSEKLCEGLCEQELAASGTGEALTDGVRAYQRTGCTGIRGEAESGYRTVRETALPLYRELRREGIHADDALVHTLLYLAAQTQDSNIIARRGADAAQYVRQEAGEAIRLGGSLTREGRQKIREMDQAFIERGISPGGSADLLAVTHFLYLIDQDQA